MDSMTSFPTPPVETPTHKRDRVLQLLGQSSALDGQKPLRPKDKRDGASYAKKDVILTIEFWGKFGWWLTEYTYIITSTRTERS